jgi:triosephosphate isomerase
MRRPLVAANWKMHLVRAEAAAFCAGLRAGLTAKAEGPEVVIFPSAPLLDTVARALEESGVAWGGQDVHQEKAGAFTGDVSAAQLRDAGCAWALCGHSERRSYHGESDELVGAKMKAAEAAGLRALFCLGELEGERQAGRTEEVLSRQLEAALAAGATNFDIAYEPVWAIGTGATASPAQAQEAHALLRAELARLRGADVAARTRILYGGSVKPENAAELFAGKDVDGFLVGGASLDCGKFLAIIAGSAG